MLYKEQTFAPRAFHSELKQQTNTVNTQKSPPWACDKWCAEACAERFSALNICAGAVSREGLVLYIPILTPEYLLPSQWIPVLAPTY